MPEIYLYTTPAPTVPDYVMERLLDMNPRVFLRWQSRYIRSGRHEGRSVWDGRWEIWCEFISSTHPDASNLLAETDVWNAEHECWMRKLQTYTNANGSFAPADEHLITGLHAADSWSDRHFYENTIEKPYNDFEEDQMLQRKTDQLDSMRYYSDHDRLLVGPHVNSGWRWRTR